MLLPKKDVPPPAQRINAGILLEQEQQAAVTGLPEKKSSDFPSSGALQATPAGQTFSPAIPSAGTSPTSPKEERPEVSPLQTYRGDIEQVVQEGQGVSVVSIAAAEATRRGKEPIQQETPEEKKAKQNSWAMLAGGAALVLLAAGVLAMVLLRPTTVPVAEAPRAPFIFVDDTALVPLPAGQGTRDMLMTSLQAARQQVRLSVGLIEWLYVAWPAAQGGAPRQLSASEFLGILSPKAPPELLRTLTANYLLGVHSFEENQPFLLLQIDSYEVAYKAMLDWEYTLSSDLLPLFSRNPSPRANQVGGGASPTSTEPAVPAQFFQTGFVDKVVENRDTRAQLNNAGDLLLLWAFLGRNTILITTNEYTLREVVSRLNTAPVVPIPGK